MLDDFFLEATPIDFYPDTPVKVYDFHLTENGMIPVTAIPKQQPTEKAFHVEILVPEKCSLIDVHDALDYVNAMYHFASFEWNTTVSSSLQVETLTICVVQMG